MNKQLMTRPLRKRSIYQVDIHDEWGMRYIDFSQIGGKVYDANVNALSRQSRFYAETWHQYINLSKQGELVSVYTHLQVFSIFQARFGSKPSSKESL